MSLVLNIAFRGLLLSAIGWNERILVPGLLDIRPSWNYGISFGLFWQSGLLGSDLLVAVLLITALAIGLFAVRATRPLVGTGLGLIAGGALGNIRDRLLHGAVFDFFAVHLGTLQLFICNIADIFISLGVLCLLAEMLLAREKA